VYSIRHAYTAGIYTDGGWQYTDAVSFYTYTYPDSTTRVDFVQNFVDVTPPRSIQPVTQALLSNHPNPFNPSTAIEYHIPSATHGTPRLEIFNLRGALVREILIPSGTRRGVLTWDGRDTSGKETSSGICLALLMNGDRMLAHHRMIRLR